MSGEQHFRATIPCVPAELVAFRQRIEEFGVELILKESIRVNNQDDDKANNGKNAVVSVDGTVPEKNITYPTDDKLYKNIIKKCWKIADEEGIDLCQSYTRLVKKLSHLQRLGKTKNGAKHARKANKKIKIIADSLVRDLSRELTALDKLGINLPSIKRYHWVLFRKRGNSNKIYSLHELDVKCYSKGKEHKKFEFGSKVSTLVDQNTGVIMGVLNFTETLHDSKTFPEVLEQYERLMNKEVDEVFVDRGYKGLPTYKPKIIHVPKADKSIHKSKRSKHSRRAAIEPVIGHLKQELSLVPEFISKEYWET